MEKAHPEAPRYAELLATTLASLGRAQLACGNRAEAARAVREAITVAESAAADLHAAKPALLKTLLASLDDATATRRRGLALLSSVSAGALFLGSGRGVACRKGQKRTQGHAGCGW